MTLKTSKTEPKQTNQPKQPTPTKTQINRTNPHTVVDLCQQPQEAF